MPALLLGLAVLAACGAPNHHLIHPHERPTEVITWSADFARNDLLVHVEGARPPGPGPFPAVIVHPEGGTRAVEMDGVIWDLAQHGYVGLAVDYERYRDGRWQPSLFAWRSASDVTPSLDVTRAYPEIDQHHIGLLGFSQGGVLSLLIAADAPDRTSAVVSYYPVTDFPRWFALERPSLLRRWANEIVRWYFRRESGAATEAEFEEVLRRASPYYAAASIRAPTLLVHGEDDATAPLSESERMRESLAATGTPVEPLVIGGGAHIFNFREPEQATIAWNATTAWFDRYLRPSALATTAGVEADKER